MVKRISNISELQDSGYGQPWPRHGLRLLYWFAKRCISDSYNDDMILLCDPERGDFGFHFFANRCGTNIKLLPDMKSPYYVVGNLNAPGAHMLPDYVKEDNSHRHEDNSNADRIIVCFLGEKKFGKVYVTTHKGLSDYDPRATFHITRTLIWLIKLYESKDDFLRDTGCVTPILALTSNIPHEHMWRYNPKLKIWVPRLDQSVSHLPLRYDDDDSDEILIDVEPPFTLYRNDVPIDVENDMATENHSELLPRKKKCWECCCTIL